MRALVVALIVAATPATAECTGRMASGGFRVAQNDTSHVYITGQRGDVCRGRLGSYSSLQIERVSVVSPARNGNASVAQSGAITYMPKPGFAGSDGVTLQVCGKSNAGPGCSTIHYHVTIN